MLAQQQPSFQKPLSPPVVGAKQAAQASGLPLPDTKETVLNFKISRKSEARITFYGEDVTQEAIEQLKNLLEVSKPVYPTQEELEAEKNRPKKAVWRNKDHDQPVTVTGELGEKDGKKVLSHRGKRSGRSCGRA